MKKVSTAVVKATKNFSQPKLTIGLDLGDRSSWYCLLDEAGEVLKEQKLSTTSKAMREVFGSMPHCRIALETGMHSPWVSRLLSELGHEVIVAHARNVRLIGESRKKDDRLDARTLARLARIDPQLLCPVKHRSAKAQADLTVIRARAGLVRSRTALINTARGLTKSYGISSVAGLRSGIAAFIGDSFSHGRSALGDAISRDDSAGICLPGGVERLERCATNNWTHWLSAMPSARLKRTPSTNSFPI
jgi:transposase